MASELKPWKYEIKYGPEGEDAYSWVYDDQGVMVAPMRTHKAKEVVDCMNTRPAPSDADTGLVTVEYQFKPGGNDYWTNTTAHNFPGYKAKGWQTRELCDRSQAEELLAAERGKVAALTQAIAHETADNAALTARVKELEADLKTFQDGTADLVNEKIDAEFKAVDLEAKLATAQKALEPFADIAGEPWADENGWTDAACQNDRIVDWFGPSAFLAARAVLGGKPS
jgi:hypothetical protein